MSELPTSGPAAAVAEETTHPSAQGDRIGSVPRDLQSRWQADANALLDEAAAREGPEAAVMYYAAARVLEERLHDPARALDALLRSASVHGPAASGQPTPEPVTFVPALRALRCHALSAGSFLAAVEYLDREIAATTEPAARAALLVEKACILEGRLLVPARAREAVEEALRAQPSSRLALSALQSVAERTGDAALLRSTLERCVGASSSSIERGRLLTRLALIAEGEPARQSDALVLFGRALEEDPTGDAAGVARAGLRRLGARLGRDVELMRGLGWEADECVAGPWRVAWRTMLAAFSRHRLGEMERATANIEAALADAPDDVALLEQAWQDQHAGGSWRRALELIEHEADLLADSGMRTSLWRMAAHLAEERLQDEERAARHLRLVLTAEPGDGAALAALERLAVRRGDASSQAELAAAAAGRADDAAVRAALALRAAEIHETALHDLNGAVGLARRALESVPGYAPAVIVLERLYSELGRWDDLLQVIEAEDLAAPDRDDKAPDGEERSARCLERLGAIYEERLADPERALSFYREWTALDVRPRAAYTALTRAADKAGDALVAAEAALALGDEKVGLDVATRVAWLYRAGVLYEERAAADDEASQAYERVLGLQPGFGPALDGLLRIYGRRKDVVALARVLQRVVSASTAPAVAGDIELARLQAELLGQPERALETLARAHERDPSHLGVAHDRVVLLSRLGRGEELATALGEMAERLTDPKAQAAVLRWQAEVLEWRLKRPREALVAVERALAVVAGSSGMGDLTCELMQERMLQLLGRHADLAALQLRRMDTATTVESDAATLADRRIDLSLRFPDGERAAAMLQRVVTDFPGNAFALEILASVLRRLGRERELQAALERLARAASDVELRAALWRAAAATADRNGERDPDTLAFHEWVLEQRPAPREAVVSLEHLAAVRGDQRRLLVARAALVELTSDPRLRGVALWQLALTQVALDDVAGACTTLEKALTAWPDLVPALRELAALREHQQEARPAAELYRRVQAASRSPAHGAEALRCAARVYLEQLGDADEAVSCLERAVTLDPAAERDFEVIESVLKPRGDIDRIAAVLKRRAAVGSRTERRDRLLRLASLLQQQEPRSEAALGALAAAVDLDPRHAPALLRLAEHLGALGRHPESVSAYRRAIAVASDSGLLLQAWLAVGALEAGPLDDAAAAVAAFGNAVTIAPADPAALLGLAEALVRRSEFDGAAEALERLVAVETDPGLRLKHLLTLGRMLADNCGDPEAAVRAFEQVLALDVANDEAMARLDHLLMELDDPARLAAVLGRHLDGLEGGAGTAEPAAAAPRPGTPARPNGGPPPLPIDVPARQRSTRALERRFRLAALLAGPLASPLRAAQELRIVLEARPDSVAVRAELARALEGAGRIREAIAEHLTLVRQDPLRVDSLRRLAAIFERSGDQDRAQRASAVLVALGCADPAQERAARRLRQGAVPEPKGTVAAAEFDSQVRHPDERHPMTAVLASLGEALPRLYPGSVERWGLGKGDRLAGRSDEPLRVLVQRVTTLFGVAEPFDTFVAPTGVKAVELELTDPPSLIVSGTLLAAAPQREAYLHVASRLARLRAGTHAALRLPAAEIELLLAAAIRLVVPDYGREVAPEAALNDLSQRIGRALSRKQRRALDDAVAELSSAPPLDLGRWLAALEHTGYRAALLVSDDLLGAFDQIVRSDRKLAAAAAQPDDLRIAARGSAEVVELIAFALGDELAGLRARLT